ncbi:MAG: hypothetical protein B6I17_02095 [Tenericutes bacterium 4572_104]|nr:MAG: hypothetical protein B6I17_02095 [Tenericutes bacterium 4572_104]
MSHNNITELNQKINILGKISEIFIQRFRVVYLLIFAMILFGFLTYLDMPREAMPEVSMNAISVSVIYQGVSANDIEELITEPLENILESTDGLDSMTSTSKSGNSSITLIFEENTDMDDAKTDVQSSVAGVSLPDGALDPTIMEFKISEMPIMSLTVRGDVSMTELKYYGELIQEEFKGVQGISDVVLSGGYTREIQLLINQSELTRYNLSMNTIKNSISNSEVSIPLSSMYLEGETFNLRIDESINTIEDIENIVIQGSKNSVILLKDIATVHDGFKTPTEYAYFYINEGEESKTSEPAIYLQVYREDNYDMVKPAEEIRKIIENDINDLVNNQVDIVVTQDMSLDVSQELDTVLDSAISGFLVVIIVLFLFIGLRESLIVASVIPLSLLISVVLLDLLGMTFNTLTLTGFIIALGLLVDNAIVILENVDRLRDFGVDRVKSSIFGSNQVAPAVFAASLTTIVAFFPLLLMKGQIGEMIRALPLTIVLAIIASFFVSIIITPALTSRFLSKFKKNEQHNLTISKKRKTINIIASSLFVAILSIAAFRDFGLWSLLFGLVFGLIMFVKNIKFVYIEKDESKSLASRYKQFLSSIISKGYKRVLILVISLLLFASSFTVLLTDRVAIELFPVEDPDLITISVIAPEGTWVNDTREIVYNIEDMLFKYDDIESFNSKIGNDNSFQLMRSGASGSNEAAIEVNLKEDRNLSGLELLEILREECTKIPGATIIVDAAITQGPSSDDISLSLKGSDPDVLEDIGSAYYEELVTIDGIVNSEFSRVSDAKELVIQFDNQKASSYGFNVMTLSQDLRNKISGLKATTYTDNDNELDVTIYIDKDSITSIQDFEKLYFTSPLGDMVGFSDIGSVAIVDAVKSIDHEDGLNVVTITADVAPAYDLSAVNQEFNSKIAGITVPKGVEEATGGSIGDIQETMRSMLIGLAAAILLVFIILSIQFNSLHQPLVILMSLPLAITGVMFGLFFTGNNLGFYAMMGIIALVGIAVNDAIVLIDYINYLRSAGIDKKEAIVEGVKTRFTPVFATSITTIGGILPLAVFNSTYGQLGIALISGLITSTLLTLLVIPVIYYMMDSLVTKIKSKTGIFIEHSIDE